MQGATRGAIAAIVSVSVAVIGLPAAAPAQTGGELQVVVTYKGKGEVSKAHEITVFLFENPIINAGSQPIAIRTIETNGGSAQFTGLTASAVYVAVAYDEKGTFTAGEGPPAAGTPVSIHGETKPGAGAAPVKPGKGAKVTITFNDVVRMQH